MSTWKLAPSVLLTQVLCSLEYFFLDLYYLQYNLTLPKFVIIIIIKEEQAMVQSLDMKSTTTERQKSIEIKLFLVSSFNNKFNLILGNRTRRHFLRKELYTFSDLKSTIRLVLVS